MRDPKERLLDMLDAIERIEKYVSKGRPAFEQDELIQTWMVHHLQIVGEAAAKVGREFHEQHPSILWPQVIAMRNVLVHDYFGVDLEEIWRVVERDLPELKNKLKKLVGELEKNK
ncbi:MAG: DUF86 domain-containing protein [Thermodesulfobacteriota bacterium]|nr:DUF86 domain-containing protein [Thermodesulfobacteriota bacterium]